MKIILSSWDINTALPKVAKGVQQYLDLQRMAAHLPNFHNDPDFRRRYNHFYRVRRGVAWQQAYFQLMGRAHQQGLPFDTILNELHKATGRLEASFASKLLATLRPTEPVIDSEVLRNLGVRLPYAGAQGRFGKICVLHKELGHAFGDFLKTQQGRYLVSEFTQMYPRANVTEEKMLDLVLWQTRQTSPGVSAQPTGTNTSVTPASID